MEVSKEGSREISRCPQPPEIERQEEKMMDGTQENDARVIEYYSRTMEGHVYVRETMDALLDVTGDRMRCLGHGPRVLHLGSHAGIVIETFLERWPDAKIAIHDEDERLTTMARQRLAGRPVDYHAGPIANLTEQVDLVISIARHHHLPHDYLDGVRRIMKPEAVYLLADELCPEYCANEHIGRAEIIHINRGYVLTSHAAVAAFHRNGAIPPEALQLERLRQRALWRWYRFVVDHAVTYGYFDIAVAELQSAHDDLVTGSDAEHKFSPLIVERQFALAGFRQLSKRSIGPANAPELQSMFIYEYGCGQISI